MTSAEEPVTGDGGIPRQLQSLSPQTNISEAMPLWGRSLSKSGPMAREATRSERGCFIVEEADEPDVREFRELTDWSSGISLLLLLLLSLLGMFAAVLSSVSRSASVPARFCRCDESRSEATS